MNRQPDLPAFADTRPTLLECDGPELQALLDDLRAKGATITSLSVVCIGRWRLCIAWPQKSSRFFPRHPHTGDRLHGQALAPALSKNMPTAPPPGDAES